MAQIEDLLPEDTLGVDAQTSDAERFFEPERLDPELSTQSVRADSPLWDPAERFVYSVFRVSGFCRESPRSWVEETEPWRAGSQLHVVTHGEEIHGVARTIVGAYGDLPVSQFEPTIEVPSGPLCEIGSLAVRPSQRGLGVANELHRVAFQFGIRERVDGFCFLIDQWMFEFFQSRYGLPVRALAPPREYMGGIVVPTGMWVPEMLEQLVRHRPHVYRWAVEGIPVDRYTEGDLPILLP